MDQLELLGRLVTVLEGLGVAYMVGGSHASMYYGEPRQTNDIDVVADLRPNHIDGLVAAFPFPDYYLDAQAAREAVQTQGQFNIIHPASGLKVDVILPRQTPYDREEFRRRQKLPLGPGREAYFARPEDVILYKMVYYREGGSDKHLRDIAAMLQISASDLDQGYIDRWARELSLTDIWQAVLRRAGPSRNEAE